MITPIAKGQPEKEWVQAYGGSYDEEAYSMIQTSDGGFALAGFTESFGEGAKDFWLVKTGSQGNGEWAENYGGVDNDSARSLIQTLDGGFALAGFTESYGAGGRDFWLVKTDSRGDEEWSQTFGGVDNDSAWSLIQTSDGGFVLAGNTESYGAGMDDFWLVKTGPQGNKEWSRTFGGSAGDWARSMIRTSDGGYALAGITRSYGDGMEDYWLVKTDFRGNEEWSQTYGRIDHDLGRSLIQTSDDGFALGGFTGSYGSGAEDFWLVKTDSKGGEEWSETYGGTGQDWAWSLIQTSDDGYALAGLTYSYTARGSDFWLVKTDSKGGEEWSETYGGIGDDWARTIVQTSDGGFALAGFTESYGAGGRDFWLVKLIGEKPARYDLSTSVNPPDGGYVNLDPTGGTYENGVEVTVTAEPGEGYEFDNWSGDIIGTSKTRTVTINSDTHVTAHFTEIGEKGADLPWTLIGIGLLVGILIIILIFFTMIGGTAIWKKA